MTTDKNIIKLVPECYAVLPCCRILYYLVSNMRVDSILYVVVVVVDVVILSFLTISEKFCFSPPICFVIELASFWLDTILYSNMKIE